MTKEKKSYRPDGSVFWIPICDPILYLIKYSVRHHLRKFLFMLTMADCYSIHFWFWPFTSPHKRLFTKYFRAKCIILLGINEAKILQLISQNESIFQFSRTLPIRIRNSKWQKSIVSLFYYKRFLWLYIVMLPTVKYVLNAMKHSNIIGLGWSSVEEHCIAYAKSWVQNSALQKNNQESPTIDEWIKKMWYLYKMECHSAMKNEILSSPGKCMELENITLSKVSQAQKTKNCMFSLICGL
jgi:hypothetical protein